MALNYERTPVHEVIGHPTLLKAGIRLLVKREDLNHRDVSGNKWWKLKYNLEKAAAENCRTLLTFGGAYSNHIYATAAAAAECNLASIGIIRGEETRPLNPTLAFAREKGMRIHYVSRAAYREKNTAQFIERLREVFGPFFLIPEGGSNHLAVKGCVEFAEVELSKIDFDHLILPTGTGGTMAGLICGLKDKRNIIGVSVLKDGGFLSGDVERMAFAFTEKKFHRWSIRTGYHHGGYAKITKDLAAFIAETQARYHLPLDPVYTAKALWAIMKEVEAGAFERGDTVLFLHTGGLQGRGVHTLS